MPRSLRTAVVTGAGGEIGRRVAEYIGGRCSRLLLIGRTERSLLALQESLCRRFPQLQTRVGVADLGNHEELKSAFVGGGPIGLDEVDCLVNCAGITNYGSSEISPDDFSRMLETNLVGPFNSMSLVLPGMKERNTGVIVNITSMSAFRARPHMGGYAATQFGLRGFCESLRKELASTKVQVSSICPGFVATRLTTDVVTDLDPSRMIQVEDVIRSVDLILSMPDTVTIPDIMLDCAAQINRAEDR